MPPPDPLALVIWAEGLEMGTAAIVSVIGATTGSGAMTVIVIGIGDTAIVGSECCVEITDLSSLLLTLYRSLPVNAVVRGPPTDAGIKQSPPLMPFQWTRVHICML